MTPDTATQSPATKRDKPDADDQRPSTQLKEAGRDPAKLAALWEKELQAAKKELTKFHTTGAQAGARSTSTSATAPASTAAWRR